MKNIPKHQQGGHGNQLGEQTHSSDHCDEPENTKGQRYYFNAYNIKPKEITSRKLTLLW